MFITIWRRDWRPRLDFSTGQRLYTHSWGRKNMVWDQHRVLEWPAKSPDLNPIENLWGIMVRTVYPNGKQYNNVHDLEVAIMDCWAQLDESILKKLADSMTNRLVEVLKRKGNFIGY